MRQNATAQDDMTHPNAADERARLQRDLSIARARNATLVRALHREIVAETLHVIGFGDAPNRLILLAQITEQQGQVPAVRFARAADGRINGVELAVLSGSGITGPRLVEQTEPARAITVGDIETTLRNAGIHFTTTSERGARIRSRRENH